MSTTTESSSVYGMPFDFNIQQPFEFTLQIAFDGLEVEDIQLAGEVACLSDFYDLVLYAFGAKQA